MAKDDMTLELVYENLTPDQHNLLQEIKLEHKNDIRVTKDKDKTIIKARQQHWIGYVKHMLDKCESLARETYELVRKSGSTVE